MALEGRLATATTPGIPGQIAVIDNRTRALLTTYISSEPEHQAARRVLRAAATAGPCVVRR